MPTQTLQGLQIKKPAPSPVLHRIALCKEWEIPLGLGRSFVVVNQNVAVFKARDGAIFAVEGTCPHRGGPLADGMIVGHQVVCPLHAFRFEAHTGACDQPGTCPIGSYPVEVENDTVFIVMPSL